MAQSILPGHADPVNSPFPGAEETKPVAAAEGSVCPPLPETAVYCFDRSWNTVPSPPLSPASCSVELCC